VNIAKQLSIPKVIIPANSSVFSAFGATLLDVRYEYQQTYLESLNEINLSEIEKSYNEIEEEGKRALRREGFKIIEIKRFAELRYEGQSYELEVEVANNNLNRDKLKADFETEHERVYGMSLEKTPVSLVNLR